MVDDATFWQSWRIRRCCAGFGMLLTDVS